MKWNKLFNELKHFLLYKADIDLKTTKLLFKILFKAISETNYKRFEANIDYLNQFLNKQLSIDATILKIATDDLVNELNKINGVNNEKHKKF